MRIIKGMGMMSIIDGPNNYSNYSNFFQYNILYN